MKYFLIFILYTTLLFSKDNIFNGIPLVGDYIKMKENEEKMNEIMNENKELKEKMNEIMNENKELKSNINFNKVNPDRWKKVREEMFE